jgi:hypothetical protein
MSNSDMCTELIKNKKVLSDLFFWPFHRKQEIVCIEGDNYNWFAISTSGIVTHDQLQFLNRIIIKKCRTEEENNAICKDEQLHSLAAPFLLIKLFAARHKMSTPDAIKQVMLQVEKRNLFDLFPADY